MKTKELLFTALITSVMMGCSNKEEKIPGIGGEVKFDMEVKDAPFVGNTENAYEFAFGENAAIGIFAIDDKLQPVASNFRFELKEGKWIPSNENINVPYDGYYTYYAYYPYNADISDMENIPFSVSTDQETDGFTASNHFTSRHRATKGQSTIDLKYNYSLALVEIILEGEDATEDAEVTLQGLANDAYVNLFKEDVITGSHLTNIKMDNTGNMTFCALVPEQSIKKNTVLLNVKSNGIDHSISHDEVINFAKGYYTSIKVDVNPKKSDISISTGNIKDWQPNGNEITEGFNPEEGKLVIIKPITETLSEGPRKDFTKDTWFCIVNKTQVGLGYAEVIASTAQDKEWDKAIKLSYKSIGTVNNSYYNVYTGFYRRNMIGTFKTPIYKLTFKAKGRRYIPDGDKEKLDAVKGATIMVTCRNNADNNSFAISANHEAIINTIATCNPKEDVDVWKDYTLYIDFSKMHTQMWGAPKFNTATDEDRKGIDIRFYTNDQAKAAGHDFVRDEIEITDVRLEPYIK
ncbi:fimbrillin family protein [Bacteroides sp.]|uniref:fimbrillin family protein n=1 Tax=Bacteroides sp. TaxID=29523 RepID=UPI0025C5D43C|nr:fimbrillin family protein [Bacteroides sp.]